jgi:hypothetical protein
MPLESSSTHTVDCHEDMDKYTSHVNKFCHLLETFVDDFINIAQTAHVEQLWHICQALLHAIHSVFPPPQITGHDGDTPISIKKLYV